MTVLSIAATSSSHNRASHRIIEIDFPVEAVIEMALAGYLDSEAIGFVDIFALTIG
jgi:hypothetical protein